ncbi:PspC domain-containing protein [Pseudonocardia sp. RS11V-5]|uniref:PspC domain-containing protein n=1 Tax=Pseudonocardia terrae TaxID=2905831 RepID=UPI001E2DD4EE|nr:PspC domain-containing protein [Pseudonocardia terrae]MCE3550562.1 PspC domain-containing protein [Pseudonocardia terrae]
MEQQTTTATPDQPIVVPAPREQKPFRLHRSRSDKMLAGVCGGLAESLDVDAGLIRIALVALTVLGFGFGIVLYLAAWFLAPEE